MRPHTALEDADAEAFFVQLLIPAADAAGKVCAVSGLIAEESRRLQASQHRGALLDHHSLKVAFHLPASLSVFCYCLLRRDVYAEGIVRIS